MSGAPHLGERPVQLGTRRDRAWREAREPAARKHRRIAGAFVSGRGQQHLAGGCRMHRPARPYLGFRAEEEATVGFVDDHHFLARQHFERRRLAALGRERHEHRVRHGSQVHRTARLRPERDQRRAEAIGTCAAIAGDESLALERSEETERGRLVKPVVGRELAQAAFTFGGAHGAKQREGANDCLSPGDRLAWSFRETRFHIVEPIVGPRARGVKAIPEIRNGRPRTWSPDMTSPRPVATTGSLERVRAMSRVLDTAIRIPGTNMRFGLDAIVGLVPGVGDLVGAGMSGFIILTAARLGAPPAVLVRMVANVGIDALVGVVPIAGDLFDAAWRANTRNAALLERHLEAPVATKRASRGVVAALLLILVLLVVGAIALAAMLFRALAGLAS